MIAWFTVVQAVNALIAGGVAGWFAARKRRPNDLTAGWLLVVELLLLAQVVVALCAPGFGNAIVGDGLEFWMYLIVALLIPAGAIGWVLIDRSTAGNVVLALAGVTVAVMLVRMQQIWNGGPLFA